MTSVPDMASPLSVGSAPAGTNLAKLATSADAPFRDQELNGPLLNPILKPQAPQSPSPRRTHHIVHPEPHRRLQQTDRVGSEPDLKRPNSPVRAVSPTRATSPNRIRPASPAAKPGIQRTLSLKAIGDSVKALVGATPEEKPPTPDVPVVPERESEKPFPFVKLHVVVPQEKEPPPFPGVKLHIIEKQPEEKPVFPGIPLHLPVEPVHQQVATANDVPTPAFPGLRLHVVDELGQKRTFVAGSGPSSPKKGEPKPISPRPGTLPLELEVRKTRNQLNSPIQESHAQRNSPRKMVPVPVSGQHALQGHRDNMEDAHVWLDWLRDDVPTLPWETRWAYYAVYDGHGGPECAHVLRPMVHHLITATPEFAAGNIQEAIRLGFQETDKQIIQRAHKEGWKSGATGVVALLNHEHIYVGNLGDSELVLGRRKKLGQPAMDAVLLTFKHKPSNPEERKRIESLGGTVVFGRLFGDLAVSRAFGDRDYKKPVWEVDYVSCDPYLSQTKMEPMLDEFLIMACDGLWDKVTYQEAVDMVRDQRAKGKTAEECAQYISDVSFQRNSRDNISTVVIFLNWITEDRDVVQRQQLRDSPRKAPDLYATAPYVPSGGPALPAAAIQPVFSGGDISSSHNNHKPESPIPTSVSSTDYPLTLPASGKAGRGLVRTGRAGMAGYTTSPTSSPGISSPLAKAVESSASSSSNTPSSRPDDASPIAAANMRESVQWEHSVSQTILSFAAEKKAAAAQASSASSNTQQQP